MDNLIASSAARLFAEAASPEAVRGMTDRVSVSPLWGAVAEAGFLDALTGEEAGGAGLGLDAVLPLLLSAGRQAVPVPVGPALLARAVAAKAGVSLPDGVVAIASGQRLDGDRLAADVPGGEFADLVLVQRGDEAVVLEAAGAGAEPTGEGSVCRMAWPAAALAAAPSLGTIALLAAGARFEAAEMAGAIETIFAMTLGYANERSQFGRPIGKFQAVQQQLAVMTELTHAARAAAALAFPVGADLSGHGDIARIAAAKVRIGEAAAEIAAMAHGLHGAIGMTHELNLHLYVDRLRRGRLRFGSERHWAWKLGRLVLAADGDTALDFVRARIA